MQPGELLTIIVGGGATAAVVSGVIQLVLWRLNRKAAKEDKYDSRPRAHYANPYSV